MNQTDMHQADVIPACSGTCMSGTRGGVSIIEVMITISLLSVAMTATIGVLGDVDQLQTTTITTEALTIATANITNLHAGASMQEIIAWTKSPTRSLATTDAPAKSTVNDLVNRGLISPEIGQFHGVDGQLLSDLRFTVGFYRTIANVDQNGAIDPNAPGLWRAQTPATLHATTNDLTTPENRSTYLITDLENTAQITPGNPVTMLVQVRAESPGQTSRLLNQYFTTLATLQP